MKTEGLRFFFENNNEVYLNVCVCLCVLAQPQNLLKIYVCIARVVAVVAHFDIKDPALLFKVLAEKQSQVEIAAVLSPVLNMKYLDTEIYISSVEAEIPSSEIILFKI